MDPEDKPSLDPASVNDVETARLALRWALERIHKLQEDGSKANQLAKDAVEKLRIATDQLKQKEESLQRWQSTIRTWDAHWRDQETLERQISERLRKEIVVEEDARFRAERAELVRQVDLLKRELADKETQAGQLQRQAIEAARDARREKDREIQNILMDQTRTFEEFQASVSGRYKIQEQNLRLREREIEDREKSVEKQLVSRQTDLERRSQHSLEEFRRAQETEQEKLRLELKEEYRKKLDDLEISYRQKNEDLQRRMEEQLAQGRRALEEQHRGKESELDLLHKQLEKLRDQYQEKEKQLVLKHEENKLRLDRLIAQNQSEALKLRQNLEEELHQREQALEERHRALEDELKKLKAKKTAVSVHTQDEKANLDPKLQAIDPLQDDEE